MPFCFFGEMLLNDFEILRVGPEEEVEDIADNRDGPEQRVEAEIPEDVQFCAKRELEPERGDERDDASNPHAYVTRNRDETEKRIQAEANAQQRELGIHQFCERAEMAKLFFNRAPVF